MALKTRTRRWLAAASEEALHSVAREVERLSAELADSRAAASQVETELAALRHRIEAVQAATAEQLAVLRGELEALRCDIAAVVSHGERLDGHDHAIEALRSRISGQAEQWRWDGDELRKAVAALAERVEQKK